MNFAAVVGLCSVWAMPFLRNNLQRHTRNQSAGDPPIEGETLFRVGHPPLFKGKWLENILSAELAGTFRGQPVVLGGVGPKLSVAAVAIFDFSAGWASRHI